MAAARVVCTISGSQREERRTCGARGSFEHFRLRCRYEEYKRQKMKNKHKTGHFDGSM
jgi:hypothetical protein